MRAGLNAGAKECTTEARRAQSSGASFLWRNEKEFDEADPAMFNAARRCWTVLFSPLGLAIAALSAITALSACCYDRAGLFVLSVPILYAWYLARCIGCGIERSKRPVEEYRIQWSLRQLLFAITCVALLIGTVLHHWPFRVRFQLSRNAFDELADRHERGQQTSVAEKAGLFVIQKTEIRRGLSCLWIGPEICFVRCTPEQARWFNLWSTEQMNDRWQLIIED